MKRLVAVLIGALATWIGVAALATATVSSVPVTTYGYDAHRSAAESTRAAIALLATSGIGSEGTIAGAGRLTRVEDALEGLRPGHQSGNLVGTEAELRGAFKSLSQGGRIDSSTTYPGTRAVRPDGYIISMREESKTGGLTVDIQRPDGTRFKLHLEDR